MIWYNVRKYSRIALWDIRRLSRGGVERDISIFCNNCIGTFVAHDLRLRFNSPTVNLYMSPQDFIEYISDLEKYRDAPIVPIESDRPYPLAVLGGRILLHLMHYETAKEGIEAWRRREQRINYDKMFFILVETDGCTHEDLEHFDRLDYPNKVALTHKPYPDIKCSYHIKGFEQRGELYRAYHFHPWLPKRTYDQFDWIKFLQGRGFKQR